MVTGGGAGIGAAVVRRLAQAGATVIFTDVDPTGAERLERELRGRDLDVQFATADAIDEQAMSAAFEIARGRSGTDVEVLVNNADAGHVTPDSPLHTGEVADFARALTGEVLPAFIATKLAIPGMMRLRRGVIVNVASCAALAADIGLIGHDVGKAAVLALTRWTAVNYAARGIRANAVCPGPTRTDASATGFSIPSIGQAIRRATPNGAIADADDQAAVVEFLASDASRHVNGVAVPVDGGMLAWNHIEVDWTTFTAFDGGGVRHASAARPRSGAGP
jgi:meso-butanediol dehydrogenase/(S,S)-butanediol dehydrogenase/diacetyl reductase